MSYTNNDESIALVDTNLTPLAVSQSQVIDTATQPGYIITGVSGSTAKFLRVESDGTIHVTGSVSLASAINVGTVDQGSSGSVPWLITGSVTVNNPSGGGSGGTVTQGPSGSEYWKITGSVGISQIVVITGSTTINNFPVTQSVKIDQSTTLPVSVSNFPATQIITGSVTVNNPVTTINQGISGSTSWLVTGSFFQINQPVTQSIKIVDVGTNVTQSITGTVLSLPFGIQTVTGTVQLNNSLLPVSISNFPSVQTITGSVGISQVVTITGSVTQNNFPVTQSIKIVDIGTNVTQSITGSVTVNGLTFASGSNLSVFITSSNVLPVTGTLAVTMAANGYGGQVEGRAADGTTIVGNPVLIAGEDGSTARSVQVDVLGRLVMAPAGSSTSVTASLATGYVTTAALTIAAIRATAYTEQTSNAQRSIVSANANDTAAGTGARTVLIEYYDQNYNGPYTETITLNGTVAVNTVATNICFIEQLFVLTAGTGAANAGIISLKATTGGGGATIVSIAVGDNRTFLAHHYVPASKITYITGLSTGHSGTTVGSGCVFVIKTRTSGSNVESQVSDFVRLYGQSSTNTRIWGTAIQVSGSTRITVYGTPETATSTVYRAAMDLYDQ